MSTATPPAVPRRKQTAIPFVDAPSLLGFALPCQVKPGREARAVVIKGTFDIVPGEPLRLRDEPDLPSGDVHEGDMTGSLRYPSDFAPFKPRADVTLQGHAFAPGGSSPAARVIFRFGRRNNGFDRTIAVFGERRWQGAMRLVPTEPRPFSKMPLVHERAFGGPGMDANPVGIGRHGDLLPNLEDPTSLVRAPGDTPAPACFGAIPMLWRSRWSRLGTFGPAWLKSRWPHFPDDFDWAFFQAAPPSQQLDHLDGDEPFEIVGMHPDHSVIKGSLPGLRARCFAQTTTEAGGAFREVVLRLDTATFDMDERKVNLLWRGLLEVRDDEASEIAELFVLTEPLAGSPATLEEAHAKYMKARAARERRGDEGESTSESAPAPTLSGPPAEPPSRPPPDLDPLRRKVLVALASGASLAGLDLTGADLSDLDFSSLSLARTCFAEARLCRCRFAGADLTEASFAGADLTDASFEGATLGRADLAGANLESASLDGAHMDEADLSGARGARASFRGAKGRKVTFMEGVWKAASFQGAQLESADFTRAAMDEAVFDEASLVAIRLYDTRGSRASFRRARLDRARADGARLVQCSFHGASATASVWDGATLDDSVFHGATLTGSGFFKASCCRAVFSGADITAGRFGRAALTGTAFLKANLMEASFEAADLEGADLRGANLHGAETWKAKLSGAKLDLAILTQTKLAERTG